MLFSILYFRFYKTIDFCIQFILIALQALTKVSLSGPMKGGFGKSMSSSLSVSTATNEGTGNKESTTGDFSNSKY